MTIFNLPDLGEGLTEAEIHEWHVQEGQHVKIDQPLVSLETAKAVVDVPSPYTGNIIKLHGKVGDLIKTHAPLVEFSETNEKPKDNGSVVGRLEESEFILEEGDMIIGAAQKSEPVIKAMPAVRALAKELQIDLASIKPTGTHGQITLEDVKQSAAKKSKLPGEVEAVHGVRRFMAISTTHSHQEVAAVTIIDDADITDLPINVDLSVRLIQAITAACHAEPSLNAWYDHYNMERCVHKEVHLGLAIDTPDGLFVPVIKHASEKSSTELRTIIDDYKKTVRDRTVSPSDLQGATMTLSNFGTIAGRYATPMIIPPMVAILGSGKVREVAAVYQGQIAVRRIIPLSLTFDHRAVTGGEASRFLAKVMECLQVNE